MKTFAEVEATFKLLEQRLRARIEVIEHKQKQLEAKDQELRCACAELNQKSRGVVIECRDARCPDYGTSHTHCVGG